MVERLSTAPPATVTLPLVMLAALNSISMVSVPSTVASSLAVKVKLKLPAIKVSAKLKVLLPAL